MWTAFLIADLDDDRGAFMPNSMPPPGEFVAHVRKGRRTQGERLDEELMSTGVSNQHMVEMARKRQVAQRAKVAGFPPYPLFPREDKRRVDKKIYIDK